MSRWSGSRLLKQAQTAENTTPKEAPKTGTQNSSKLSFKVGAATVAQSWCKCLHFVTVVTILNLSAHGADQVFSLKRFRLESGSEEPSGNLRC